MARFTIPPVPLFVAVVTLPFASAASSANATPPELASDASEPLRQGLRDEAKGQDAAIEISEAALQAVILRFDGEFASRMQDAFAPLLAAPEPKTRAQALRNLLDYVSSSLDIAMGADPVVNLLDMVAFTELAQAAFARHWLPEVYGEAGRAVLEALEAVTTDAWALAEAVLTANQQRLLSALIQDWLRENRDRITVESVRLTEFAAVVGAREQEVQQRTSGLLAGVKRAVVSADRALLTANRALYLVQRMPYLARAHARLLAYSVTADATPRAQAIETTITRTVQSILINIVIAGAVLIVLWGVVYVLAKVLAARLTRQRDPSSR